MIKKRTRPSGLRGKTLQDDSAANNTDIPDLLAIRKLRRPQEGIDLERFNRGDQTGTAVQAPGLQTSSHDEFEDELSRMMRMVKSNNFTQQTNIVDADKHMLDYIEQEMAKRRGHKDTVTQSIDPLEELYKMAKKYKWDMDKAPEEGNVVNSMGMLTSIPEVDLGMENRLRNIEATERAKRAMQPEPEREKHQGYAAARYQKATPRVASDVHATATDAEVYERFKKRFKR